MPPASPLAWQLPIILAEIYFNYELRGTVGFGRRWVMKNKLMARLAILTLALSGALSIGALAQTTDEGPGPSEQPSAPMEVGQDQSGQDQSYDGAQSDA